MSFYITTPIYYVNAVPHIGTVYTTLVCDVIARFKRLEGQKVRFLTGTDEHGAKIEKSARDKGVDPQQFVDQVSEHFSKIFQRMNISNNDFIRTTEERHKKAVNHFWKVLQDNGHIYLDKYSGWYAIRDESFYAESELVNGKAPTGAEVEWVEEESYFFDLSKWQTKLLEFYKENPDFVKPSWRFNEIIKFVESGLHDLSVSRTGVKWGIPVPNSPNHTIYVWLDALVNYISALGYPSVDSIDYKELWPANIHMVGKDITKFHAIYWPAFLMAAGIPLPKHIVSHGWWLNEGEKISKSLGNVIDPNEIVDAYGLDYVRYYLMREISFGNDGNFTKDSFVNRINSELANKIGNLLQRTLSMVFKNCDEKIPDCKRNIDYLYNNYDVLKNAANLYSEVKVLFDDYQFSKVLEKIALYADELNRFVDVSAPWLLKNTDPEKMQEILYVVLESVRYLGIILSPFIPDSSQKILFQLKVPIKERDFVHLSKEFALEAHHILKPESVFPRIDESKHDN
jgi:methionyl-tRNA synthetase